MKVLVIGASRGIGLEFARQYLAEGAQVIATARDDEGLQRLKGLGAKALRVDVAQPTSISGLAWLLDGEEIDIALYVAGVFPHGDALAPPTREAFDHAMHTNVLGAMQAIPQVAPLVEAVRGGGGRFAFISSAMAKMDGVDSSRGWVYRASKAALNMVVASAQHDYPKAIMVALSPGWVQTDMGGSGAPLTTVQSVTAMRAALAGLTPEHKGAFLNYDGVPFKSW
ncbi:SDR family oxidoreductase [Polaromonas sp. JS666]|uniref:SDR family oxidoreductase n=1 Tax=Polaromonas sp. (strain JS666 / ATCC BAA-500) TaxID=296591 RepID=UPI00088C1871|nr:SDR family oxidoreductase [Polaromonas sp. JS666]SDN99157.1 Short-chain dehydrogenase [Polaromonas sp. JS666]